MSALTLATCLHMTLAVWGANGYAEAHDDAIATGKPLLIMVSTDWCAPCQRMKKEIIPEVRKHGILDQVSFVIINPDQEEKLAQKLIGSGPIPQLLMYRHTPDGWKRRKLIGGQTTTAVEEFINGGLTLQQSDRVSLRTDGFHQTASTVIAH